MSIAMSLYRSLKRITIITFSFAALLISIAHINALGCQYTIKLLTKTPNIEVFSVCNSGIVTTRITNKKTPTKEGIEIKSRAFSLYNHHIRYIYSWNPDDMKKTLQPPFYIYFSNNTFLYSSINRFNNEWVGFHIDAPIHISYLGEVEGYLSLQDRFNLTNK